MFNSDKQPLETLLRRAQEGKLLLPDFQRSYVWTEDSVISLLASILRGYPVGALLTLERGGEVNFKPRGLEGTNVQGIQPERRSSQVPRRAAHTVTYDALPYAPQIMALAVYFALMGSAGGTAAAKAKLARWFWAGILGEHYGSGTDTKIARDVPELRRWTLDPNSPEPLIFSVTYMQADRLNSLRNRRAAVYKGFHALLMKCGCRDFVTGDGFDVMSLWQAPIDVHHIFPEAWCKTHGKEPDDYNSIINKTPLSAATNRGVLEWRCTFRVSRAH